MKLLSVDDNEGNVDTTVAQFQPPQRQIEIAPVNGNKDVPEVKTTSFLICKKTKSVLYLAAQIIMQTGKRAASRSIPAQEVNIVAAPKLANEEEFSMRSPHSHLCKRLV